MTVCIQAQVRKTEIESLSPLYKTLITLYHNEELSYKEIAETLGISTKTVENHIGKALKIMREELKPLLKDLAKLFIVFYISF